jgi:tetratricopeptide (TPR) repeat protein
VDNFEAVDDARIRAFLADFPEPSKALVTSRRQDVSDAWAVSISGLEPDGAIALIRREARRLGLRSLEEAEEPKLQPLVDATGGAPLAIRWAVGQIKQRGQSLPKVIVALRQATGNVFQEVFERSWTLLGEPARQVLTMMPIFASPASRGAIEAASDMSYDRLDSALGQLVTMRLVEEADELEEERRRHSIHPLTRAFAQGRLQAEPELEYGARQRAAAWFVGWALRRGEKFAWTEHPDLEEELPNVIAFARWSRERRLLQQVLEYHRALYYFLGVRGYWTERLELDVMAVEAARETGDVRALAWGLIDLSWIQIRRDELQQARASATEALRVVEGTDDPMLILTAKRRLSEVDEREQRFIEAERWLHEALVLNERLAEPRHSQNLVRLRQSLGNVYYLMRHLDKAREHLEAAAASRSRRAPTTGGPSSSRGWPISRETRAAKRMPSGFTRSRWRSGSASDNWRNLPRPSEISVGCWRNRDRRTGPHNSCARPSDHSSDLAPSRMWRACTNCCWSSGYEGGQTPPGRWLRGASAARAGAVLPFLGVGCHDGGILPRLRCLGDLLRTHAPRPNAPRAVTAAALAAKYRNDH